MSKINANIAAQPQTVPPKRNYELDFLKLFFAVMVFWCHTPDLEYSGEKITVPQKKRADLCLKNSRRFR